MGRQDLAVLIGNGLSIAFDDALSIPKINEAVTVRLNAAGGEGTAPAVAMQRFAANISGTDPKENFEALLGPFDQFRDAAGMLRDLTQMARRAQASDIERALRTSSQFAEDLRRLGVGHTLAQIAQRSVSRHESRSPVESFIEAMLAASLGQVCIGNLNYDSLVLSTLVSRHAHELCDMSDGRARKEFTIIPGRAPIAGRPLRTDQNFPSGRRITLLHLHGSLSWLRGPDDLVYSFPIQDLRDYKYWKYWRDGETQWSPEVVLTNQSTKTAVVKRYPFALAYDAFFQRLLTSRRWVLAGYSFGDGCVNDMLGRAWRQQTRKPKICVITKGRALTRARVLESLGYDSELGDPPASDFLTMQREGIEEALQTISWEHFSQVWPVPGRRAG